MTNRMKFIITFLCIKNNNCDQRIANGFYLKIVKHLILGKFETPTFFI